MDNYIYHIVATHQQLQATAAPTVHLVFPDSGQQHQSYIGEHGDVAMIPTTPPSDLLSFLP